MNSQANHLRIIYQKTYLNFLKVFIIPLRDFLFCPFRSAVFSTFVMTIKTLV